MNRKADLANVVIDPALAAINAEIAVLEMRAALDTISTRYIRVML